MRILVTGGAGFIGSHIVESFQEKAEIVILDNLSTGNLKNLEGFNFEFINADIRDRAAVKLAMRGVDYVFHLAAMVSVPESMEHPVECVDINTKGTLIVLEEAAKANVKKLCYSSSSAVYGDNPETPKKESMIPMPKSPYAVSKLDGEYYCGMFTESGCLNTVGLRYFNVFGPRQNPESEYASVIPLFIMKAIKGKALDIYGEGKQTRDFVFVKDVVAANLFFAKKNYTGIYNVGYAKELTINKLADEIIRMLGSKSKVRHLKERAGDVKHSLSSIAKLLSTGFKPQYNFHDGLVATINYFLGIKH